MSAPSGIRFGGGIRWEGLPAHLRALGLTALVAGALFGAAVWWTSGDDGPGTKTFVVGEADGGRLLIGLDQVALGGVADDRIVWRSLDAADNDVDTGFGRVLMAAGPVAGGALTEARFVFGTAAAVSDGALQDLRIDADRLDLRVPGPAGRPGDTLLVVFDVERSVVVQGELLVFRPFVSHAEWLAPDGSRRLGDGSGDLIGDTLAQEPWQTRGNLSDVTAGGGPRGPGGGGSGGGTGGGGAGGGDGDGPSSHRGAVAVFVRDVAVERVKHLNVTFAKVAVGPVGGGPADAATYFSGAKVIDVRAYDGPDDRAWLTTFQLPAGEYGSLHFEFAPSEAVVFGSRAALTVPQPRLVVEVPFTVQPGRTLTLLADFSVDESLVASGDGWEFRPVLYQFQRGSDDTDADGVDDVADPDDDNDGIPDMRDADRDGDLRADQKPRQYRVGGSALPSIGHANEETVKQGTGTDPGAILSDDDEGQTRPVGSEGSAPLPEVPGEVDDALPKLPGAPTVSGLPGG